MEEAPLPSHPLPRRDPKEFPWDKAAGWGLPSPIVSLKSPQKLLTAEILVLVEFSCFFKNFFPSLGGGWGGNRGCRAEHRAGLNFSLMCLAEVLTVRNSTEIFSTGKKTPADIWTFPGLHHQHSPRSSGADRPPEESPGFLFYFIIIIYIFFFFSPHPVTTAPKRGCAHTHANPINANKTDSSGFV